MFQNRTSYTAQQKARYQENSKVQPEYRQCRYHENLENKIKYQKASYWEKTEILKYKDNITKRGTKKRKKRYDKVKNFLQQVKQRSYYLCTIGNRSAYQWSVKLFKHGSYRILTAKLYHPEKSFEEKLYIYKTCYKHLHNNQFPCETACNNMGLDTIPDKLRELKQLEKVLISKRILLKKIAIKYRKINFIN